MAANTWSWQSGFSSLQNTTRNSQTSSWLYTHVSICIQHRPQTHYIINQHLANKKVCPPLPRKLKIPPKTSVGNLSFHTFIFSKATHMWIKIKITRSIHSKKPKPCPQPISHSADIRTVTHRAVWGSFGQSCASVNHGLSRHSMTLHLWPHEQSRVRGEIIILDWQPTDWLRRVKEADADLCAARRSWPDLSAARSLSRPLAKAHWVVPLRFCSAIKLHSHLKVRNFQTHSPLCRLV